LNNEGLWAENSNGTLEDFYAEVELGCKCLSRL
jgi:hypothetical protein